MEEEIKNFLDSKNKQWYCEWLDEYLCEYINYTDKIAFSKNNHLVDYDLKHIDYKDYGDNCEDLKKLMLDLYTIIVDEKSIGYMLKCKETKETFILLTLKEVTNLATYLRLKRPSLVWPLLYFYEVCKYNLSNNHVYYQRNLDNYIGVENENLMTTFDAFESFSKFYREYNPGFKVYIDMLIESKYGSVDKYMDKVKPYEIYYAKFLVEDLAQNEEDLYIDDQSGDMDDLDLYFYTNNNHELTRIFYHAKPYLTNYEYDLVNKKIIIHESKKIDNYKDMVSDKIYNSLQDDRAEFEGLYANTFPFDLRDFYIETGDTNLLFYECKKLPEGELRDSLSEAIQKCLDDKYQSVK